LSFPPDKTVIIVAGPTSVGKTAVAINLAKHFKAEIISADSRQCFKELKIGVARPAETELIEVPHHFIASHSISEPINAAYFENWALQKVEELFAKNNVVVMVGGTGLYLKAFCEGLDDISAVDDSIRQKIIDNYEIKGLPWLQEEIKLKDPQFYESGEMQNPQRMMRALEVIESTGQSIFSFRKGKKSQRNFQIVKIGLELPKAELLQNINIRVDKMMEEGLVDEVRPLQEFQKLNALQTVGYAEIFSYLRNENSIEEAVDKIKINTRQYAKRQLTWFRKDKAYKWFHPNQLDEMIGYIESQAKS
jgi:tRNA dimethylallyltransferase